MVKQVSRQHDIRIRLLNLLLHLSNADTSGKDLELDQASTFSQSDLENESHLKQQEELQIWRGILSEGEICPERFSENGDSLSDWTSSDDDGNNEEIQKIIAKEMKNSAENEFKNSPQGASVVVILPGCVKPLRPPERVPPPGQSTHVDPVQAKQWLYKHVLPHYWIREKDGRTNTNYPISLAAGLKTENGTILRSTANLVNDLDLYYANTAGLPVEEKTVITEYQIMREILWTFRFPLLSDRSMTSRKFKPEEEINTEISYPLFSYDSNKCVFVANPGWICMPSVSPEALLASLQILCEALTSLHHLASFIENVLDRPIPQKFSNVTEHNLPPLTFEAYADGLSNIIKLLSADLIDIETTVRERKVTFTLLDLKLKLSPWFRVLNCLARFHANAVITHVAPVEKGAECDKQASNWQASMTLLASLNAAIGSEFKDDMYAIFVDLFLKSLAPYFRIMGLWVSQGRLEDWRDEFVFAVNPEFHTNQMRLQSGNVYSTSSDDQDIEDESASDLYSNGLFETFWTRGFISRPYKTFLKAINLEVPEIFDWSFPRILTCGKSIEILTILQKQGRLETSSSSQFKYYVSHTQLYEEFLSNVKESLKEHRRGNTYEKDTIVGQSIQSCSEKKLRVSDIIDEDISDFDPYLVAAFDTVFSQIGNQDNEDSKTNGDKKEILKLQSGGKDFLLLSDFGLDAMKPLTNKLEACLAPVIVKHVDTASLGLLNLFRNTLNLEQHLTWVRKVFLMEAGDLLSEFYTSIFESSAQIIESTQRTLNSAGGSIDSLSLTMLLHDCLSRRPSTAEEMVERFSVKVDGNTASDNMEGNIHLSYHVEWPLNIVLHSTSLSMYNKVFQFLLKVKHALWALQEINAKDLAIALENAQKLRASAIKEHSYLEGSDEDDSFKSGVCETPMNNTYSKKTSPPNEIQFDELKEKRKIHRILLLRSWLLHFVGNIHSYFMTRVLHTTQLELQGALNEEGEHKINDLDDIISAHNRYIERIHDRCFLHQSTIVLREAVVKVFNTCVALHKHCRQFVNDYHGVLGAERDCCDIQTEMQLLKSKQYHLLKSSKDDNGCGLLVSEKLLHNFEESYSRSHQFLATTLRSLSQKRNVPHLDGLAAALIYTSPNRAHS